MSRADSARVGVHVAGGAVVVALCAVRIGRHIGLHVGAAAHGVPWTLCDPKDIGEVMQLQSDFLRNQFGIATEDIKKTTGEAAAAPKDISKEEPDLI